MFEKVNPSHPDKIADRIAGALVDYCYTQDENPKCAFEVTIGHKQCYITGECSIDIPTAVVSKIVSRITRFDPNNNIFIQYNVFPQDYRLADNQANGPVCGDNGIFKFHAPNNEEKFLTTLVKDLYFFHGYTSDAKFIIYNSEPDYYPTVICCQSGIINFPINNVNNFRKTCASILNLPDECFIINPIGYWTGGLDVDTGCTNRKLGSDLGRSVTGGGIHGKDLTKSDVAINIYMWDRQLDGREAVCKIGDKNVLFLYNGKVENIVPYEEIVEVARKYIKNIGGFEKLAMWGLLDY